MRATPEVTNATVWRRFFPYRQPTVRTPLTNRRCLKSVQILHWSARARFATRTIADPLLSSPKMQIRHALLNASGRAAEGRASAARCQSLSRVRLFHSVLHRNRFGAPIGTPRLRAFNKTLLSTVPGNSFGQCVGEFDAGRFGRTPRQRIQPISGPRCSHAASRLEGGGTAATA